MLQAHSGRLIRTLRANEVEEFRRWFKAINAQRTKVVGFVLLVFSFISLGLSLFGRLPDPASLFLSISTLLVSGLLCISLGQIRSRPLCYFGELVVLATAIGWMFWATASRVEIAFGLSEFIVGTLGLALLRYMRPLLSILVFAGFSLGYGTTLWLVDAFEIEAWLNATLFCCFAVIWSWNTFNSRVIEFRNDLLVDQLHRKNHQLSALALQDALTGLPNRRYFDQILETHWSDESREDVPVVLIMADIDYFKAYNDQHGHPQGDRCLQRVAQILIQSLRSDGECVRLGGEEFAVVLFGASQEEGVTVAHRLAREVRRDGQVTLSFGVAALQPSEGSLIQLYSASDFALYEAKRGGRNRIESARMDSLSHMQAPSECSSPGINANSQRSTGE